MTTADKLTRLKTDFDDVYNKGYEQGKAEAEGYEWVEDNSEVVYSAKCYQNIGITMTITENGTAKFEHNGYTLQGHDIPQWAYNDYSNGLIHLGANMPILYTVKQAEVVNNDSRTITKLGNGVFSIMNNLKTVRLPDTITKLGQAVFACCESLKKVELPPAITSIGEKAFQNCYRLESFKIPDLVTSLEINTFDSCRSLKTIDGIERMTSIGGGCFSSCHSLSGSIVFNANLAKLTGNTFRYCANIKEFVFLGVPESMTSNDFDKCVSVENFSIPKGWNINLYLSSMSNLNEECVQNITDNIADLTGLEGKTIQFHKDVKARIVADDAKEDTDPTKRFWLRTLTSKNVTLA